MFNDPQEKMTFEDAMKEIENLVYSHYKCDVSIDDDI